jgi:hypothetical protein
MDGFLEPAGFPPPPEPPRRPDQAGQRRPHPERPSWNLHLQSSGTNLPARFLNDSPSVAVLVVEDMCWEAAREAWKSRRPRWWRPRARAAWLAEGAALDRKAERLRDLAGDVLQEL